MDNENKENKEAQVQADDAAKNAAAKDGEGTVLKDAKTGDEKALEHIQSVLDKTEGDGSGDGAGDGDDHGGEGNGDPGDGDDSAKGDDKKGNPGEGDKPNAEEHKEDAKPDGDGGDRKPDGKGEDGDKLVKLLESGVFDEFRNEGTLSQEGWNRFMDGFEALVKEVVDGRGKMKDVAEMLERRRAEELDKRLDAAFEGLGDEFSEAFGKGTASGLDKALLDNRNAVLQKAETLLLGYRAQGKDVTLEDAVKEAAGLWVAQNFKRPAERRTQQDRRGQFISKPAGERPVAAKGDEAALDFIDKFVKEREKG